MLFLKKEKKEERCVTECFYLYGWISVSYCFSLSLLIVTFILCDIFCSYGENPK